MGEAELKEWEGSILKQLKHIADIEYQKLAWQGLIEGIADSPVETINTLYDWDFEGYIKYLFEKENSDNQLAQSMWILNQMIEEYPDSDLEVPKIWEDPRWIMVTRQAREIVDNWKSKEANS